MLEEASADHRGDQCSFFILTNLTSILMLIHVNVQSGITRLSYNWLPFTKHCGGKKEKTNNGRKIHLHSPDIDLAQ